MFTLFTSREFKEFGKELENLKGLLIKAFYIEKIVIFLNRILRWEK